MISPSGEPVVFPGRHSEALFVALCLNPGVPLDRDVLAERLWPNLELTSKRTRLRQELAHLKRLVGLSEEGGLLVQGRATVAVDAERVTTDLMQFLQYTRQGNTESLRSAVALYRGELTERHEELASGRRQEIAELFEGTMATLAARERALGHYDEAKLLLQKLLERDSLNLAAHSELMRLYAEQGQPEGVHRQWQKAEASWRETLHTAPPETLAALATELQRTSNPPPALPALVAPVTTPTASGFSTPANLPAPAPVHRRFLWIIPFALALLGGMRAYLYARPTPEKPIPARVDWHYEVMPESPQEKPNSEGKAAAVAPNGVVCAVGLIETTNEDTDILAVFFSPEGKLLKQSRYSSPSHDCDRAFSVVADAEGNFFVAGESYLPEALGRHEGWRLTLLKYDATGALLWARNSTECTQNEGHRIQVVLDGQGGVYVAGTALIKSGEKEGKRHPLLLHYTSEGKPLWSRTLTPEGTEATFGALCADSQGSTYLGTTQIKNDGPSDWLVASYDLAGNLRWQKSVEGQFQGENRASGIAISRFGTLFVAGTQQISVENRVLALARFDSSGKLLGMSQDFEPRADMQLTCLSLAENGLRVALAGEHTSLDGVIKADSVVFNEQGKTRWRQKPVTPTPYRSNSNPRIFMDRYGGMVMVSQLSRGTRLAPIATDGDLLLSRFGPDGSLRETQLFNSAEDANDELNALVCLPDSKPVIIGQRTPSLDHAYLQAVKLDSLAHP